jgi:ABC-type glycerol-3-phosphate transport system substrate-binding protein
MNTSLSRRQLLRYLGVAGAASVAAACQPQVVEVEKIVTQVVKETIEVQKEVEKVVEKTVVVEKEVTVAVAADKPATVTYWGYGVGARFVPGRPWGQAKPEDYIQWQEETFEELHPNTKVNVELLVHDDTYFTKIDAALMAGTQPDIVMGPVSEAAKYISRKLVSPIDEYMSPKDKDDTSALVMKEMNFGGMHYLWPWRLSYGGGMYANGKILEERGVKDLLPQDDERKAWTPEQFLEMCKACTYDANGDGKIDIYGTAVAGLRSYLVTQWLFGYGAEFWNEDESAVIINSPEGVAGLQFVYDLEWVHKVAVPGTASFRLNDVPPMWESGQVAVIPHAGAGGRTAPIDDAEAKGIMEFIFCMPPSVDGATPGVMTNIHGYYVMVNKDLDQTWWAHKFCEHLIRPEAIALCLASGLPPARQSFWGQVGEDPNMRVGVRMVNYMKSFGRRAAANKIVMTNLPKVFSAVFSQQMGAKEALDAFAAESTKLLQDEIAGKA